MGERLGKGFDGGLGDVVCRHCRGQSAARITRKIVTRVEARGGGEETELTGRVSGRLGDALLATSDYDSSMSPLSHDAVCEGLVTKCQRSAKPLARPSLT